MKTRHGGVNATRPAAATGNEGGERPKSLREDPPAPPCPTPWGETPSPRDNTAGDSNSRPACALAPVFSASQGVSTAWRPLPEPESINPTDKEVITP